MHRLSRLSRLGSGTVTALALGLVVVAAALVVIFGNPTVGSARIPEAVQLSSLPTGSPVPSPTPTSSPSSRSKEPVETVTPSGTVVVLPSPESGDQGSGSRCSSDSSCSSGGS